MRGEIDRVDSAIASHYIPSTMSIKILDNYSDAYASRMYYHASLKAQRACGQDCTIPYKARNKNEPSHPT